MGIRRFTETTGQKEKRESGEAVAVKIYLPLMWPKNDDDDCGEKDDEG